jgi:hypothetical protein
VVGPCSFRDLCSFPRQEAYNIWANSEHPIYLFGSQPHVFLEKVRRKTCVACQQPFQKKNIAHQLLFPLPDTLLDPKWLQIWLRQDLLVHFLAVYCSVSSSCSRHTSLSKSSSTADDKRLKIKARTWKNKLKRIRCNLVAGRRLRKAPKKNESH